MKRWIKYVIGLLVLLAVILALFRCGKDHSVDLTTYLNSTLEYFVADSGIEITYNDAGYYENHAKSLRVTVKDNVIQSIELTGEMDKYSIYGVTVGRKEKSVKRIIKDIFTATPEKVDVTSGTSYEYQSGNKLLTVVYTDEKKVTSVMIEITNFTVGSIASDATSTIQIDQAEVIVKVGAIEVSYSEAMIYMRIAQQLYESEFGNQVFSFDIQGNGTTIGSILKQEVLNQIIQLEVINLVANKEGIILNDDEMLQVRGYASDYMKTLSEEEKAMYGITEELVVQVYATNLIASKVYETVTIDVDTDVADEDAQQIRIYKLFLKNYGEDSKGNHTILRDSELEEIKEKISMLYEQAKETTDFYSFAESNSEENQIEYVVGKGELDSELEEAAFSLKTGQLSKIIETTDGYAILYCANDYDEDATLQKKEEIIEQRRSDLFVDLYSKWFKEYEVKVNMDLWNQVELLPIEGE